MRNLARSLIVLFLVVCLTGQAAAEEACQPAEPKVPRGIVLRTALGAAVWTGEVGDSSQVGLGFTFGAGYEFFSWLAVEGSWSTGFHDTNQPFPPASGNFATHAFHFTSRFTLPLDAFDLFLRGGVGWSWSQPDILLRIEEFDASPRFSWLGGGGFTWHTPRRKVWVGLECNAIGSISSFPGIWIVSSAVLGVTL